MVQNEVLKDHLENKVQNKVHHFDKSNNSELDIVLRELHILIKIPYPNLIRYRFLLNLLQYYQEKQVLFFHYQTKEDDNFHQVQYY